MMQLRNNTTIPRMRYKQTDIARDFNTVSNTRNHSRGKNGFQNQPELALNESPD